MKMITVKPENEQDRSDRGSIPRELIPPTAENAKKLLDLNEGNDCLLPCNCHGGCLPLLVRSGTTEEYSLC